MEKAYKLEFKTTETGMLTVNSCGCSRTEGLHSFGPAIKPHFLLHYILSGKGVFRLNDRSYPLEAGFGFLISPEQLVFYQADEKEPWTYVWVGFSGDGAERIVQEMGLSDQHPVFRSDKGDKLYAIVKEMIEHNTYEISNELKRVGLLHLFLSIVAENTPMEEKETLEKGNNYVRKAISYIQSNYCNPIKIADIADYVCINRSYLYTLFENAMAMSPQQFLTTFRLTKATELLQLTELSIESIALSCGYSDPFVFTKAFKQAKGISPSGYRKAVISGEERRNTENLKGVEEFIRQINEI
ncbi:MAG: AraC family transcriptional regulator [Lachnospiraceae bacterium]|nr:AraC family transcriptional regulator [Lachnospiraceae bacterium]